MGLTGAEALRTFILFIISSPDLKISAIPLWESKQNREVASVTFLEVRDSQRGAYWDRVPQLPSLLVELSKR